MAMPTRSVEPIAHCLAGAGASAMRMGDCKGSEADPCVADDRGATTGGMVQCWSGESASWARELEIALARARQDQTRAPYLEAAQQSWAAWRDAECRYQASRYEGGSLARVLRMQCLADLTAERVIELLAQERDGAP